MKLSSAKATAAESFNDLFSNIVGKLVDKLQLPSGMFDQNYVTKYYKRKNDMCINEYKLETVGEDEISKLLQTIGILVI